MSTKILDSTSLTIRVPVLSDEMILKRQFLGKTMGNDEALDKVYELLASWRGDAIILRMVMVEPQPSLGSSPEEIVSSSCDAMNTAEDSLAKPSLAQIGGVASLFQEEVDVQRAIPLVLNGKVSCVVWTRSSWPTAKQPIFRFHNRDEDFIHGVVIVMLPTVFK